MVFLRERTQEDPNSFLTDVSKRDPYRPFVGWHSLEIWALRYRRINWFCSLWWGLFRSLWLPSGDMAKVRWNVAATSSPNLKGKGVGNFLFKLTGKTEKSVLVQSNWFLEFHIITISYYTIKQNDWLQIFDVIAIREVRLLQKINPKETPVTRGKSGKTHLPDP